ncbi:TPA: hypothetical protein ACQ39K_005018 [Yersinia enterocolitica]
MGALLGVHRLTISRIECGTNPITVPIALSLSFLLALVSEQQSSEAEKSHTFRHQPSSLKENSRHVLNKVQKEFLLEIQSTSSEGNRLSTSAGNRNPRRRR